ncbi:hypothetical protein FRB99_001423 [Tulasnella sp. 403]|nr:hypothetical protein FRB99_001423 [Tulasnella sp. 403]
MCRTHTAPAQPIAQAMDVSSPQTNRSQKGKLASRASWSDIPPELLRLIADQIVHPIWYYNFTHPIASWRESYFTNQQKLWAMLMTVNSITNMRIVCRSWEKAMETHSVWNHICQILDPHCQDAQYHIPIPRPSLQEGGTATPPRPTRIPRIRTYTNYARTVSRCCLACRFANSLSSQGVNAGTNYYYTRPFGDVLLCDKHKVEAVCGLCLKDAYLDTWTVVDGRLVTDPKERSICITDDAEFFRGVTATCRPCRLSLLQQPLRVRGYKQTHPIIENIIEPFIECGEGSIKDILADVEEKIWLLHYTNFNELHESAVVAQRMKLKQEFRAEREAEASNRRTVASESLLQELLDNDAAPEAIQAAIAIQEAEDDDDEELLDEDFADILNASEEQNVCDMALNGWARNRILDGCWISPIDVYQGYGGPRVKADALLRLQPAWHPVNSFPNPNLMEHTDPQVTAPLPSTKPKAGTIRCPVPPPRLFQRAQYHFEMTLRRILLPAMENLVRRLVYEAELEGKDVCRLATMFSSSMLVEELTAIQLWGTDYDWSSCQTSPTITSTTTIESSSDRESPPSTIRTTPSPSPPSFTSPKTSLPSSGVFATAQRTALPSPSSTVIPLPTRYLSHIPHVPRAPEHVGPNALCLVDHVWREACAGLFKCQCGICLRASGIADARERVKRKARDDQEDVEAPREVPEIEGEPLQTLQREKAPSVSPKLRSVNVSDESEAGELPSSGRGPSSTPSSPRSLRRSRTATSDDEDLDDGRDRKRYKISPPQSVEPTGRRRGREEIEDTDVAMKETVEDQTREVKKSRVDQAEV